MTKEITMNHGYLRFLSTHDPVSTAERELQSALDALCLAIDTPEEAKALLALLPGLRDGLTVSYLAGLRDGKDKAA